MASLRKAQIVFHEVEVHCYKKNTISETAKNRRSVAAESLCIWSSQKHVYFLRGYFSSLRERES